MTHDDAADVLDYAIDFLDNSSHVKPRQHEDVSEACKIAQSLLRSVASASADAEKGFEAWRTQMLAEPVRKTVQYTDKDVFLAGHAAATAVKQAEVDVLCDEVERMDVLLLNFHSNPILYAHEARKAHAEIYNNRPPRVTEILARRKEQINAVE